MLQDEALRVFYLPPEPEKFYLCLIGVSGGMGMSLSTLKLCRGCSLSPSQLSLVFGPQIFDKNKLHGFCERF